MKIAFIAPYDELSKLVQKISKEMKVKVDVFSGKFQSGVEIARKLESEKYEILISRGATYSNISKVVNIPVINCDMSSFDILYAVHEAVKFSKKVGLIIHEKIP